MEETQNVQAEQTQEEPKVYKSFEVNYYTDGRIELKSTGEQKLTTEEMYEHVNNLKEVIQVQKIREAAEEAAFRGAQAVFTQMARMRMQAENEKKTNEGPTMQ